MILVDRTGIVEVRSTREINEDLVSVGVDREVRALESCSQLPLQPDTVLMMLTHISSRIFRFWGIICCELPVRKVL